MRIELNGYIIIQLTDGRYKATDAHAFATIVTPDLDVALDFVARCSRALAA
jgi:hypothetical protein